MSSLAFASETSCNINVYYLSNNTLKSQTFPPLNNHSIGEINLAFMGGYYDLITIEQPVMTIVIKVVPQLKLPKSLSSQILHVKLSINFHP